MSLLLWVGMNSTVITLSPIDRFATLRGLCPPRHARWIALVLGLLIGAFAAPPRAHAEPVFTNKERFRIPYQLDDAEIKRLGATEIQLHVSTDNGRSWRHVDSVPPVEGKFTFEAAGDGEYSFAVRTVDRLGNLHPAGPLVASLRVTVDTTSPELRIDVEQAEPGRVLVRWDASDAHLHAESLHLEHRDPTTGDWQPMSIEATAAGQTNWSLADGGTVEVRGTVRDEAGNETSAESGGTIEKAISEPEEPVAAPKARQRPEPIAEADPVPSGIAEDDPAPLPSINPEIVAFRRTLPSALGEQPAATQPRGDETAAAEADAPQSVPESETAARPEETPPPASPPLAEGAVRRVSSTTFQIAYQLDDVGPSGIGSVDLYLTENDGQKWYHYGADQDRRSPFQVTVPDDGTYGFAIRVKSGVGLAMIPPQPGDAPDLTIVVDRQPPKADLLPVRTGENGKDPRLILEWSVTDDALAEKPVALSYSENASGPWQTLSGWQPNTGQYVWNIGPNVPPQVYVRLEARDAAGNTARVETDEPITIDLSKPTARFLNVETVQ